MSLAENVKQNAEHTIKMFAGSHRIQLDFDEKAVKFLDDFINESGRNFNEKQKEKLIDFLGSFLGECIRRNYGGRWEMIDAAAVKFDEKNAVFSFNKIAKHFQNGPEDSILGFYQLIPIVFRLNK